MAGIADSSALVERVQLEAKRRRLRLHDFFTHFDRTNRRRVTVSQAVRVLSQLDLTLTEAERGALQTWVDARGDFDYDAFCDAVNEVFGEAKGLERHPDATIPDPLAGMDTLGSVGGGAHSLSEEEVEKLEATLQKLGRVVHTRALHVKRFLTGYDRLNTGLVTENQFKRGLVDCFGPLASMEDLDVLAKAYMHGEGPSRRVCYRDVHETLMQAAAAIREGKGRGVSFASLDATGKAGSPVRTAATAAPARVPMRGPGGETRPRPHRAAPTIDEVMERAADAVVKRRVRVRDFFVPFDRLHTEHITRDQFIRAVVLMRLDGVDATGAEVIADAFFSPGRGLVDYMAFSDRIEAGFGTRKGLERDPDAAPVADAVERVKAQGGAQPQAVPLEDEDAEERVQETLKWARRIVRDRGIDVVQMFKDFDRGNEEHVTPGRFLRVLASLRLLPPATDAQTALVERFRGVGRRSALVNWRAYKNAVDPPMEAPTASSSSATTTFTDTRGRELAAAGAGARPSGASLGISSASTADARETMHRLKRWVRSRGVRLEEFMLARDRHRKGCVTAEEFLGSITGAGFALTQAEADALEAAYADSALGLDARGEALVDVRRFCDDIEAMFTTKGLERYPDADGDASIKRAWTRTGGLRVGGKSEADEDEEEEDTAVAGSSREHAGAVELLQRLRNWVSQNRIDLVPGFRAFDRTGAGRISVSRFKRALSQLNVPVSVDESQLLVSVFSSLGPDGRADVSWRWFSTVLDERSPPIDTMLHRMPRAREPLRLADASVAADRGIDIHEARAAAHAARAGADALPMSDRTRTAFDIAPSVATRGDASEGEVVMEKLAQLCADRGIRLKTFFADHDRINRGSITRAKLATALRAAGLRLHPAEIDALANSHVDPRFPDMVRWRDISDVIDGGQEHLETDPDATVTRTVPGMLRNRIRYDRDEDLRESADSICRSVRKGVADRGVDLKTMCKAFDPHNRSTLATVRFQAVLADTGLRMNPTDIVTLSNAFQVEGVKDRVNWRRFLQLVDPAAVGEEE